MKSIYDPVRIPMIISLMMFNERVLEQGKYPTHSDKPISLDKMKEIVFFNMVYLSNMDEMIDKYHKQYIENSLDVQHEKNIQIINNRMENIRNDLNTWYGINITKSLDPKIIMDEISGYIPEKKEQQSFEISKAVDVMNRDQLIEYPLDSFNDYLEFLNAAANHPDVTEIKVCLYRIGKDPAILNTIEKAVKRGVKIHVNIELRASGEDINYDWMKKFQEIGCIVTTYGYGELKVHCKLTLVKFINGKSVVQIGTGNYHTKTTTQYTDLSLVTSNDDICRQVDKVFSILKGKHIKDTVFTSKLLVTRYNAREKLVKLIRSQANPDGYICFKCNALDDDEIISELNRAAVKGCTMELIIRGVCTWVPQVENVRVRSIVWDKLEHSRVYCFGKTNPKVYIGSLDLVTHKLDKRIETLVKITNLRILLQVVKYLNRYITTSIGYTLGPDGRYHKEVNNGL